VRETLALFAEIRKQEPHATLTWVGSVQADHDPYTKAVQEDVTRLGLADAVRWERLTPQDMPQAYATHDLLLHLSATGSLDKVIPESLAAGCAVFSTNPATIEAVGEKWGWSGRADQDARAEATEALHRMDQGVSSDEREQAARTFSLQGLIQRIIHVLIDKK
jgi:glycosyltransferase involved in cell wall biosynthesis